MPASSDRWAKCLHESAHATVALAFGMRVRSATVIPNGVVGGSVVVAVPADGERKLASASTTTLATAHLIRWMWSAAGEIGMEVAGLAAWGCADDQRAAHDALDDFWTTTGVPPWRMRLLLDSTVRGYLRAHWGVVVEVAAALYDKGTLGTDDLLKFAARLPALDLAELRSVLAYWSRAPAPA